MTAPGSTWAPFAPVRRLPANTRGRDFAIGDVHGAFSLVVKALAAVDFDPAADRLFCVGDLIDRGPDSAVVEHFLAQPWVHAVCGNHEANLLSLYLQGEPTDADLAPWVASFGLHWWLDTPEARRDAILERLAQLPLAIEVATARGTVGLIHADVPFGMDWSAFTTALDRDDPRVVHTCLWGRERHRSGDTSGVAGIGRLLVGHTICGTVKRLGNVYMLDSGAVFGLNGQIAGGHLTLVETMLTSVAMVASPSPGLVDVRAGMLPATPFGQYATPHAMSSS